MNPNRSARHLIREILIAGALLALAPVAGMAIAEDTFDSLALESKGLEKERSELASLRGSIGREEAELKKVLSQLRVQLKDVKATEERLAADAPRVRGLCSGEVPEEAFAAAQAACNAALVPYNTQLADWKESRADVEAQADANSVKINNLKTRKADLDRRTRDLAARQKSIEARRKALKAKKKMTPLERCVADCSASASSDEEVKACSNACFDGSSSSSNTVIGPNGTGEGTKFFRLPNRQRTPEEAIEEYKRSGKENPGPKVKIDRGVPPPK